MNYDMKLEQWMDGSILYCAVDTIVQDMFVHLLAFARYNLYGETSKLRYVKNYIDHSTGHRLYYGPIFISWQCCVAHK